MGRADGSASLPGFQAVCRARAALRGGVARPLDSTGRLAGRSPQGVGPGIAGSRWRGKKMFKRLHLIANNTRFLVLGERGVFANLGMTPTIF